MVKKGGGARDRIIMELMYLKGLVIMRTRTRTRTEIHVKRVFLGHM